MEPTSVFLTPCNKYEIKELINGLKNKTSSGYDNISNILLKGISDELLEPLTMMFNISLSLGIFLLDMKLADVIPLYKSGSHLMLTNYQPISLLPTISKLLEKVFYICMYTFLDSNNAIYKSQCGFHKKHSYEHATTELVGEICKGPENGKHMVALS